MFRRKDSDSKDSDFDLEAGTDQMSLDASAGEVSVLSTHQVDNFLNKQHQAALNVTSQSSHLGASASNAASGANIPSYASAPLPASVTSAFNTPSAPMRSEPTVNRTSASPFRPATQNSPLERPRSAPEGKPASYANVGAARDSRRVLTVGADILLKGEITTCDRLIIEGKVDATVNDVNTMEVADCGAFKGTATVEYAEISGTFEGDLLVKNLLVIYSTGKVTGKVTYGEIEIQRGGELTGEIKVSQTSGSGVSSATRKANERQKEAA